MGRAPSLQGLDRRGARASCRHTLLSRGAAGGADEARFALEALASAGIGSDRRRQHLDGHEATWSADGKQLLWPSGRGFAAANVTTRPSFAIGNPVDVPARVGITGPSVSRTYDVLPAGRFIGTPAAPNEGGSQAVPTIEVVLNWTEELKRLVPSR